MKNPYEILKINQNATKQEIAKAFVMAQKNNLATKEFTPQEIMSAQKQLLNPSKRLAADFMFPSQKRKKPTKLEINVILNNINFVSIDANTFDSLNNLKP